MNPLFSPPDQPTLPITENESRFPVRRIYCVGRNYAEHTLEMGGDPTREAPFFFSKPADAIMQTNSEIAYPKSTGNLHYEMELVIAINKGGEDLSTAEAGSLIYGYAAGIDLTRRDLQSEAKKKGRPWDTAKGFDQSAPCAAITSIDTVGDISSSRIWLQVNGTIKQEAKISDMIWDPIEIVAHLSHFYKLEPGDLIFTGTPAGVGELKPGDQVTGGIDGLENISITIV